ncbi:MAG: hypothetical protein A2293_03535 [Elusimicrobia bacterium RIFOXYB2_FULL_49_7]|nr:MAG: hypothetical protein A2293_03535 [Elusimicrobia bacterium RIFOXYB2_FULL_49_7]
MNRIAAASHQERADLFRSAASAPKERLNSLELDYSRMSGMIFGKKPSWSKIISDLLKLEKRINRMRFV